MLSAKSKKQLTEFDHRIKALEKIIREQQTAIKNLRKSVIASLSLMISIAEEPHINKESLTRLMTESMKDAEKVLEKNEFGKIVKGLGGLAGGGGGKTEKDGPEKP
ncbi:MAG TPA: hypothetical protein PKL97_09400 [Candidatus Omnitrophota bacterium]|mgnify:CR=1 FL=1|nr:hypothetical protein [Candidatus Omnitrophota bacterium]